MVSKSSYIGGRPGAGGWEGGRLGPGPRRGGLDNDAIGGLPVERNLVGDHVAVAVVRQRDHSAVSASEGKGHGERRGKEIKKKGEKKKKKKRDRTGRQQQLT